MSAIDKAVSRLYAQGHRGMTPGEKADFIKRVVAEEMPARVPMNELDEEWNACRSELLGEG